jgi:serine/threonine-protein kinase
MATVGYPQNLGTLADGRYRLESILGQGGMAVVYAAWDSRLEVRRAVKVLLPAMANNAPVRRRFEREARVMARLHHPHILTVHDVGTDGSRVYIVMELLRGGSLADLMEHDERGLEPWLALGYAEQVLEALHFTHGRGVIHRDIKPQNVLLESGGGVRVADFGIARCDDTTEHHLTRTGAVMGTWAFMAPELRGDATRAGPSTDLFATGVTLYAMLTRRTPVDLYASNLEEEHFRGMDPALRGLIRTATAYHPDQRFASAQQMALAIRAVRETMTDPERRPLPPLLLPPAEEPASSPAPQAGPTRTVTMDGPASEESGGSTFSFEANPEPSVQEVAEPVAPLAPGPEDAAVSPAEPPEPAGATAVPSETRPANQHRRRWPALGLAGVGLLGAALVVGLQARWLSTPEPDVAPSPLPVAATPLPAGLAADASERPPQWPESLSAAGAEPVQGDEDLPATDPHPGTAAPSDPARTQGGQVPARARAHPASGTSRPGTGSDAGPPSPTLHGPERAPSEEPVSASAQEPPPVSVPAPAPGPVMVSLRVLSDPIGAAVQVAGRLVTTPGTVEIPVGEHHFVLTGAGWTKECEQEIRRGASRVKFSQGAEGCVVIY